MVKELLLYYLSLDYFSNQYIVLATNTRRKVYWAAMGIASPKIVSIPSPSSDSAKD
jgi:hypothetical protein